MSKVGVLVVFLICYTVDSTPSKKCERTMNGLQSRCVSKKGTCVVLIFRDALKLICLLTTSYFHLITYEIVISSVFILKNCKIQKYKLFSDKMHALSALDGINVL